MSKRIVALGVLAGYLLYTCVGSTISSKVVFLNNRNLPLLLQEAYRTAPRLPDLMDYLENRTILRETAWDTSGSIILSYLYYFRADGRFLLWETNWPVIQHGRWSHEGKLGLVHDSSGYYTRVFQKVCIVNDESTLDESEGACVLVTDLNKIVRGSPTVDSVKGDVFQLEDRKKAPFPLPSQRTGIPALEQMLLQGTQK